MMLVVPQQRWRGSLGGTCLVSHGQILVPSSQMRARRCCKTQQSSASPGAFRPAPPSHVLAPAWSSWGAMAQLVGSRGTSSRPSASSLVPWAGQQGVGQAVPLSCAPPWAPPPLGESASMISGVAVGVWRRAACQSQRVVPTFLSIRSATFLLSHSRSA